MSRLLIYVTEDFWISCSSRRPAFQQALIRMMMGQTLDQGHQHRKGHSFLLYHVSDQRQSDPVSQRAGVRVEEGMRDPVYF